MASLSPVVISRSSEYSEVNCVHNSLTITSGYLPSSGGVIDVRRTKSFIYKESQTKTPRDIVFRVTNSLSLRYSLGGNLLFLDSHFPVFYFREITFEPEPDSDQVSYEVELKHDNQKDQVFKFERGVNPSGIRFESGKESQVNLTFRVMYHELDTIPKAIYTDFKKILFSSIKDVTLIGSDGQKVGANLFVLKMRSPVFQAMFEEETSKEFQTKTVVIEEYTKESLAAFVHFLTTEEINLPNENVVDLMRLGHKYQVPSLFSAAKRFILDHVNAQNADALFEEFELLSRDVLKTAFKKTYLKN